MDTIEKIKQDCINMGVKPPNGLNKSKLLDYRNNLIYAVKKTICK